MLQQVHYDIYTVACCDLFVFIIMLSVNFLIQVVLE